MSNITSMSRKDQAHRRLQVYQHYKKLTQDSVGKKITKERIYQEVAAKFNYINVTSVKAIVRELKLEEEKQNEINIYLGKGVFEAVLASVDLLNPDFNSLNFTYSLEHSKDIDSTIFISGSYHNSENKIITCFDHFSVSDVKASVIRINNLLQECYQNYN